MPEFDQARHDLQKERRLADAGIAADERDARLAIEMPPGGVLTCLTRQAGWRGETLSLERSGVDVARHLAQRLSD